ncbi:hypothetical protein CJF32_00004447 [Rutstroemia sp. NJR-2017a WRK4]|nr:hypothetical protein CJF32_00004447 [Rutstroemia sp. NJR-2017a WRK4]
MMRNKKDWVCTRHCLNDFGLTACRSTASPVFVIVRWSITSRPAPIRSPQCLGHRNRDWPMGDRVCVPPNCSFEVNDAEEPWTYSQKFDYIHGRAMLSCFSSPSSVIKSAYSSLRPGGYLEMQDPQMPITCIDSSLEGTALQEWGRLSCLAAEKRGRKLTNSKNYGRFMEEAGFVDIVEKHFYWPCNPWPKGKKEKLLAVWTQQNLMDGIHAMTMRNLTTGLGWSPEEVEMLLVETRKDIKNRRIHSYIDVVVFYGRKPGLEETL